MDNSLREAPTTLYRAFDSEGVLLYVGIAVDWGRRWSQHRERSHWYGQVTRVELEQHSTRSGAREAERQAVEDEKPIHNIEHTAADQRPFARKARTELHVTSYDHARAIGIEGYAELWAAIDRFANACGRARTPVLAGQEGLVRLLAEMARAVPYGDCCRPCGAIAHPLAVEVNGEYLRASYRHCTTWTTGWAVDAPLLGPG